ncbi:hypothetical protein GCM10022420_034580 [Streptomyces iranensis]|uniref:Uncharacterized protein n=1 Tax=Streptomyces iranensis TaxID=576784 RepID=A0A060ZNZ5_9ACTN|nr:hypothetical protein [Streptomyces iranensis]MBP2062754.1 hypothetical protein [Streptomyces iranensis]CDR04668.1 predicted protein [Streptomyces iranensis]
MGGHRELRAAIGLLGLLLVYMIRSWMTETTSGAWPRVLGDAGPPARAGGRGEGGQGVIGRS